MFNNSTIMLLTLISFTYIIQTTLLFLGLALYTPAKLSFSVYNGFAMKHASIKTLFVSLLLAYSGLPPFFVFFFKILLLLKLNTPNWAAIIYILLNSAAVYYYLNFIVKLASRVHCTYRVKGIKLIKQTTFYLTHVLFLNLTSFLFLYYILMLYL